MQYIQESEPIKVHGAVVASYGSERSAAQRGGRRQGWGARRRLLPPLLFLLPTAGAVGCLCAD